MDIWISECLTETNKNSQFCIRGKFEETICGKRTENEIQLIWVVSYIVNNLWGILLTYGLRPDETKQNAMASGDAPHFA